MKLDIEMQHYGKIIDRYSAQLRIMESWSRSLLEVAVFMEECSIELSCVIIFKVFIDFPMVLFVG